MKKKILFFFLFLYILLIGQSKSSKENKFEDTNSIKEEEKIKIDENIVIKPAPEFKRCGADNLEIKPIPLDSNNIIGNHLNNDNDNGN